MKGWFLSLVVLTVVAGCNREEEASPNDGLYRKWVITQMQYQTGDPVTVTAINPWAIVEYKANGMILYGEDGKYDPCCSPAKFKRERAILDLSDVASIPFPERTPNGLCALASCVTIDNFWEITTLDSTQLVIKQSRVTVSYKPYP